MMKTLPKVSPQQAKAMMDAGSGVLIDIREPDEFARAHIPGARSVPLSQFNHSQWAVASGQTPIFTCRSGMRTDGACSQLAARVDGEAYLLSGGLNGWTAAGLPVAVDEKAPMEIMRQVQIAAGSMVLIGVILGFLIHPGWFGLSAFVGAGLTFAGISGFCGMARVLAMAPWNRVRSA